MVLRGGLIVGLLIAMFSSPLGSAVGLPPSLLLALAVAAPAAGLLGLERGLAYGLGRHRRLVRSLMIEPAVRIVIGGLLTVVAGAAGAVERAGVRLKEAGAKRVLPLPVSAPFHCALMAPVKARLEPVLRGIAWRAPLRPVVTNVEAKANADAGRIVPLLVEQVTSPVRWIECVEELVRLGVTRMVEVGPGKVLSGLAKRIDKSVEVWNVEDRASLEKTLAALKA
jgi:malonyl CoA-acyl carrier protein transacylase